MSELTYNPVLEDRTLPKWRLGSPLRPPGPGQALVLVQADGAPLTIRSGDEVPSARFGQYQSAFTVDLTEHRLILDVEPLLSRDPTFSFRGRVDLVSQVTDPAEVVRRGIRDMSGALYGHLRKMLREVSRDYDIAEFHEAEMALNATLRDFTGDSAIRLRNIHLELLVDEDEVAASGRDYRDVVRETRLDRMKRERHLDLLREEGEAGLVAEVMEREGPRAALAWAEKRHADERNARLAAAEMVLKRGDADREPFEQAELERTVVEDILGDGGLFGEGSRRSRLKGALASSRSAEPEPREEPREAAERPPLKGRVEPPRDTSDDSRLGEATRRRHDPAPSDVSSSFTPPDDEPLPSSGWGRAARERETKERGAEKRGPEAGRSDERAADAPAGIDISARTGTGRGTDNGQVGSSGISAGRRESRVRGTAKRRPTNGPHEERR